jgi:flagellar hook-length control protein FliK
MHSLITGAKRLLTDQLEARIPKNRVPKTLKGLLETAIRFNIVVSDITLENLPQSKVTKELLATLNMPVKDMKATQESALPSLASKVLGEDKGETKVKVDQAVTKTSPLEQMLKGQEQVKGKESIKGQEPVKAATATELASKEAEVMKEQPLTKAMETAAAPVKNVAQPREKEKEKSKVDTKESSKLAAKEKLGMESLKSAPIENGAKAQTATQKGGALEKLLSADSSEQATTETKSTQESTQTTSSNSSVASKQDTAGVKPDTAMGAKMAEARQLVSQLSADVKEAMQNYKPPFTKLSMKLNPERLGEIDVMMVQRGNNVHINLTSNGTALGMLQQNSADLKSALADAGLGDATMNFSSNGESRNPSQEQQQKHSTSEHYAEMSKILDDIDTLELVVPRYV